MTFQGDICIIAGFSQIDHAELAWRRNAARLKDMLELTEIHYKPATSGRAILNGVSMRAQQGRPLLISGESGSGKTSLLEIISGMVGAQSGTIQWKGSNLNQRQRRWLCGVVFQFPERHFLGLSVGQELKLGHRRLAGDEQTEVLSQVGLHGVDSRQAPERLSGGQQRRLALAVQLLRKPEVLLLDEPTAGLDWSVRGEVLDLLYTLSRQRVLIVVTHEPDLFRGWNCEHRQLRDGQLLALSP